MQTMCATTGVHVGNYNYVYFPSLSSVWLTTHSCKRKQKQKQTKTKQKQKNETIFLSRHVGWFNSIHFLRTLRTLLQIHGMIISYFLLKAGSNNALCFMCKGILVSVRRPWWMYRWPKTFQKNLTSDGVLK